MALELLSQWRQRQSAIDPCETGLYSVALNGPWPYQSLTELWQQESTLIGRIQTLRKRWPPKQHFRQNAPLRATHYSLALKLAGPLVSFVDPWTGLADAVEWAALDLAQGRVKRALLLAAFAADEEQNLEFFAATAPELSEAALLLELAPAVGPSPLLWEKGLHRAELPYGVCSPFFQGLLPWDITV